jgi:hypothetical protein
MLKELPLVAMILVGYSLFATAYKSGPPVYWRSAVAAISQVTDSLSR